MGTGCLSQHSDKLKDALVKAVDEHRARSAWCAAPAAWDLAPPARWCCVDPEETLYQHVQGRARRGRRRQPGRRACGRTAVRPARALRPAGPRGAGELRPHRSGKDRRLHCPRRLPGPADGAHRDDAQRRDPPDHRKRPARARRRRLSDRPEVGHGCQGRRRPEIRDLQRRRRRPRRIHGSQRSGKRSAARD